MGGSISVFSNLGVGSTFTIKLVSPISHWEDKSKNIVSLNLNHLLDQRVINYNQKTV